MKFLRKLNTFVIAIALTVVYGIAFGVAKILMLITAPSFQSPESYWIREKQEKNNDYQSPY